MQPSAARQKPADELGLFIKILFVKHFPCWGRARAMIILVSIFRSTEHAFVLQQWLEPNKNPSPKKESERKRRENKAHDEIKSPCLSTINLKQLISTFNMCPPPFVPKYTWKWRPKRGGWGRENNGRNVCLMYDENKSHVCCERLSVSEAHRKKGEEPK